VELFIEEMRERMGTAVTGVTDAAMWALVHHAWPGNIRELRNAIERGMILAAGEAQIDVVHLPDIVRGVPAASGDAVGGGLGLADTLPLDGMDLKSIRDGWEQRMVVQALERTEGNQSAAARLLNLTRDELRYRVDKFGLPI
jgi:DNA-binding NtrC family response regulator